MKISRHISIVFVLVLLVNLGIGFRVYSKEAAADRSDQVLEQIDLLMEVLQLIRKNYVDADKVKADDLMHGAISGMVMSLDPYSNFLPPEDMQSLKEETEGEFGGVGISVSMENGFLTVISTIDGTPAHQAGILTGDRIVAVDNTRLENSSLDESVKLLRGPTGSKVVIYVIREGAEQELRFELTRALIPLESVSGVKVIPDTNIGYMRIIQFMEPTAEAVEKVLREFEAKKVSALVIDLRGNPGGLLSSAIEVCSFFLPPDQVIVSVEGRNKTADYQEKTRRGYKFPRKCPIIVLINGGSASAAEITAGCLRDLNRAVLLGEKTFGKGSVQTVHELPGGYALKLTVAKYYTPGRRVIHGEGIQPDITVAMSHEDYFRISRAAEDDKIKVDAQLNRAVEVLQSYDIYEQIRSGKVKVRKDSELEEGKNL